MVKRRDRRWREGPRRNSRSVAQANDRVGSRRDGFHRGRKLAALVQDVERRREVGAGGRFDRYGGRTFPTRPWGGFDPRPSPKAPAPFFRFLTPPANGRYFPARAPAAKEGLFLKPPHP